MQLSKSKISDSEESFHISVRSPGAYNLEPPLPAMKFPSGDGLLEQGLSGGRGGSNSSRSNKVGNTAMMRLAAILTFMQFLFAMYATFLLYYLSPSVPDLMAQPDASWASQIVKLFPTRVEGSGAYSVNHNGLPKRVVCQSEEIDFSQKKSTNTKIVELKTTLFRYACSQTLNFESSCLFAIIPCQQCQSWQGWGIPYYKTFCEFVRELLFCMNVRLLQWLRHAEKTFPLVAST